MTQKEEIDDLHKDVAGILMLFRNLDNRVRQQVGNDQTAVQELTRRVGALESRGLDLNQTESRPARKPLR